MRLIPPSSLTKGNRNGITETNTFSCFTRYIPPFHLVIRRTDIHLGSLLFVLYELGRTGGRCDGSSYIPPHSNDWRRLPVKLLSTTRRSEFWNSPDTRLIWRRKWDRRWWWAECSGKDRRVREDDVIFWRRSVCIVRYMVIHMFSLYLPLSSLLCRFCIRRLCSHQIIYKTTSKKRVRYKTDYDDYALCTCK